jgi:hypothetical protein
VSLRVGTFSTFPEAVLSHNKGDAECNAEKGSRLYAQQKTTISMHLGLPFLAPAKCAVVPPDGAAVHLQR